MNHFLDGKAPPGGPRRKRRGGPWWRGLVTGLFWGAGLFLAAGCGADLRDPRIEAVLPDRAKPGQLVDIIGDRLEGKERFASFGGQAAEVVLWQAQRARVRVPTIAPGLTVVVVQVDGRPSSGVTFLVEGNTSTDSGGGE